ncbi:MAG TPA: hypothetical protein VFT99_05045 [Roseiflexaceae bacterium]|nr:hypothetical protein [Roseiflexaceae bacterium]
MRIQQTCVRLLLVAMWLSVATLASAPAPARAQSTSGEWHAWNMKVDFPPPAPGQSRMPRVIVTSYDARWNSLLKRVEVLSITQNDISALCKTVDVTYDTANAAHFNGVSSSIRCPMPTQPVCVTCNNGIFWVAADVQLTNAVSPNPIFEGRRNGARQLGLALPGQNGQARTKFTINGTNYTSPAWAIDATAGNRVMLATHGVMLIDLIKTLEAQNVFWLNFVPNWQTYYTDINPELKNGHLSQAPDVFTSTGTGFHQWSNASEIVIGASPSTGQYFNGSITNLEIDPPGCFGG